MLALLQADAVALPVIEQMLAEGRLATLAGLRQRGTWVPIDTEATILQSATYPTLCTGIDVREHGLYSSFPWSPPDQRARYLHALPKPQTVWERLTERGRRSLVVDPILAWTPREMAGVYLNGWNYEDRMLTQARSVPRDTRRALARRYGRPPRLDDVYGTRQVSSLLAMRGHLVAAPSRTADAVLDLLDREAFDLVWVNFSAAHKAGHQLWDPARVTDAPLAGEIEDGLRQGLRDVYAEVDTAIGRILDVLPPGSDVIVFSPTGMGANSSRADLLPAMLAAVLRGGPNGAAPPGRSRTPIWSLRSGIPTSWRSLTARALPDRLVADITTRLYVRADWQRTRAIAVPGENKGYVRVNLRGREREGIVDPVEADALMETITEGLLEFRDADGSPSISKVQRMTELAGGAPCSERLPDLVVHWGERPGASVTGVSSARFGEVVRQGVGSGRSGNHVDDAWAILLPDTSRMRELGRPVRLTDIPATACALLEADMTGLSGESLLEARQ